MVVSPQQKLAARALRDAGIAVARLFSRAEAAAWHTAVMADPQWEAGRILARQATGDAAVIRRSDRIADCNHLDTLPEVAACFERRIRRRLLPGVLARFGPCVESLAECHAVRYHEGGQYRPHIDNGPGLAHRQFTVVCYLNDDVKGGETHFPEIDVTATPSAGMAIVFPSEYLHAARPVMAGTKVVLVCWMHGPLSIQWI